MAVSRIFNIMQYERHPITGEVLMTEKQIKAGLDHKTIKRWAYACHDKDVYSEVDEANDKDGRIKAGDVKPRHWHICIELGTNRLEIGTIAKWFGVPENFVEIAKGAGAFLDIVQYLTHERDEQQALGKRLYPDEEIFSNFDFRALLDKRAENRALYGKDLTQKEQWRYDVRYKGKTLLQCQREDPHAYIEDSKRLKELRLEYLAQLDPPHTRFNFYVQGRGGVGKGLMSRALARNLFPNMTSDSEIFFEVGAPGAAFEGYDGQPVIIWNDRRHGTLLKELKGRENVFNVFDTHPTRQKQNIKFGSIALCNLFNIVNSIEPYEEFLDGFVARRKNENGDWEEEEDKGQSYRRFPFIIPIHEDDFDFLLNRGFMEGSDKFTEFLQYGHVRGNMQRIAERCKKNERLARALESQTLAPVIDKVLEIQSNFEDEQAMTEEQEKAIMSEMAHFGSLIAPVPVSSVPAISTTPVVNIPILPDDYIIYKGKIYPLGKQATDDEMEELEQMEDVRTVETFEELGIQPICDASVVFGDDFEDGQVHFGHGYPVREYNTTVDEDDDTIPF